MITRINILPAKEFEETYSLEAALLEWTVITNAHGTAEEREDLDINLFLLPFEPSEGFVTAALLEILLADDSRDSRSILFIAGDESLDDSWPAALYYFVLRSLGMGPAGNEVRTVVPDQEKLDAISKIAWRNPGCREYVTNRVDRLTLQLPAIEQSLGRLKTWMAEARAPFKRGERLLLSDPPQVVEVVGFDCWRGCPSVILRSLTLPTFTYTYPLDTLLKVAQRVVSIESEPEAKEPAETP